MLFFNNEVKKIRKKEIKKFSFLFPPIINIINTPHILSFKKQRKKEQKNYYRVLSFIDFFKTLILLISLFLLQFFQKLLNSVLPSKREGKTNII